MGQMRLSGLLTSAETMRATARRAVAARYAPDATESLLVTELTTPTRTPMAPPDTETR